MSRTRNLLVGQRAARLTERRPADLASVGRQARTLDAVQGRRRAHHFYRTKGNSWPGSARLGFQKGDLRSFVRSDVCPVHQLPCKIAGARTQMLMMNVLAALQRAERPLTAEELLPDCGAPSFTVLRWHLAALRQRGLVTKMADRTWMLTAEGREAAAQSIEPD